MRRQVIGVAFIISLILLLAACGTTSIHDKISEHYPVDDVVESSADSGDTARIFVAEGESLENVAASIRELGEPNNISEMKDNKQILVYNDYFVTLTEDEDDPGNTLIEVATQGFVRDNYSPGFFTGFFAAYVLDEILDVDDWGKRQQQRCVGAGGDCYKGYNQSGGAYKGPTAPSLFRGSSLRGGGPGVGK